MFIPYIIDSFRGGVSDEDSKGIEGSFKLGKTLDIHKRRDSLTCQQAMATVGSGTVDGLVNFFVKGTDDSLYGFSSNGDIYSIAGDHDDPVVGTRYVDANGAIKGADLWGLDDDSYYFFWATDTSVSRKQMSTSNSGMDWGNASLNWKTTLSSTDWHAMKKACGKLLIANLDYLAGVDFDGGYNASLFNIEPGNTMKCLESRGDYVIIGSSSESHDEEGMIWAWISTATNYINKKKIPVSGVNALIDTEFTLLQGGTDGEIFLSDFTDTEPLAAVPLEGYCDPGGVTIVNDLALFNIYGGTHNGLWSYGRRNRNRGVALNFEYRFAVEVAGSTISHAGGVGTINGTVYAAWKTIDGSTTSYGVDQVSDTTKVTSTFEGLEFDGGSPHLNKTFRDVHLIMAPLPASTSVAVKVKLDKDSSWTDLYTPSGSTTFTQTDATEAVFLLSGKSRILEMGVTLTPTANLTPEVLAIVTYVEEETTEY